MLSDSQLVHTLFKHLLSRLFWFDAAHERANRCWVGGVYVWANFWGTREMVDFQDFSTSTRCTHVRQLKVRNVKAVILFKRFVIIGELVVLFTDFVDENVFYNLLKYTTFDGKR